ncbi:MAG: hypothetical protein NT013_16880 [Planctomycetia bacterium]|nr:hypothetical protein [Planctomycetia bacterium]
MTIPVQCPACLKEYGLRDELAGKRVRCKECGENISVPLLRTMDNNDAEPSLVKPKPTTKPKPVAKKHNDDDLVLDDDDDIDNYDDILDEPDEFESVSRSRSPVKKRRKKSSGQVLAVFANGFGKLIEGMKFKVSLFSLFIFFCLGICFTTLIFPAAIIPILPLLVFGGIALMIFSSLWSIVVTFRVSVGWAIFFFVAGMANGYFTANGQPGIGAIIYIVSFLLNIMLVIEHWDEYRGPILCSVASMVLIMTGPFAAICGIVGAGGVIPLGRPMPVINGGGQPMPVINGGTLPLPRNDGPFPLVNNAKQDVVPLVPVEVDLFPVADVPVPGLPEFTLGPGGRGEPLSIAGISCNRLFFISARSDPRLPITVPGVNTSMIYFEPIGPHRPQSLPCVLFVSAGSNLLEGRECLTKESVNEIVPYVSNRSRILKRSRVIWDFLRSVGDVVSRHGRTDCETNA